MKRHSDCGRLFAIFMTLESHVITPNVIGYSFRAHAWNFRHASGINGSEMQRVKESDGTRLAPVATRNSLADHSIDLAARRSELRVGKDPSYGQGGTRKPRSRSAKAVFYQ
jgi:hypothetical protein